MEYILQSIAEAAYTMYKTLHSVLFLLITICIGILMPYYHRNIPNIHIRPYINTYNTCFFIRNFKYKWNSIAHQQIGFLLGNELWLTQIYMCNEIHFKQCVFGERTLNLIYLLNKMYLMVTCFHEYVLVIFEWHLIISKYVVCVHDGVGQSCRIRWIYKFLFEYTSYPL